MIPGLGLRSEENEEDQGLDLSDHSERGYVADGADQQKELIMIRIDAVVRPERVNIVLEAMAAAGCTGFTYGNVQVEELSKVLKSLLEEVAQLLTEFHFLKL